MSTAFQLESEALGHAAEAKRKRNMRRGFIAKTWQLWFCYGQWLPDDPEWSCCGMIWHYQGEQGAVRFGAN